MSRTPFIVANWKMHKTSKEAEEFIQTLSQKGLPAHKRVGIAPPFTALAAAVKAAKGTGIEIGAQTMHDQLEGPFTGEISASMLKLEGATFVILGHSERRQYANETNEQINKKVHLALKEKLHPILCIGETLKERQEGHHLAILTTQLKLCLKGLSSSLASQLTLSYEPIWAIGTGRAATPEMVQEIHAEIRSFLEGEFGVDCAGKVNLLYGGSVKVENSASLLAQTDIDGLLVGGASLDVDTFTRIMTS